MHGIELCIVVELSCLPTHNIVPHISWHDPPCRKTTKRYSDFPNMTIFNCSLGNSGFKHGSVIVNNIFAYFTLSLSTSQVYMIWERCWFFQINFCIEYFPHRINVLFLSSQFYVIHIHREKNFHGVRISVPSWKPSLNRASIGFSQIAFPITVLPKDDRTDFAQEERLDLPCWTMI